MFSSLVQSLQSFLLYSSPPLCLLRSVFWICPDATVRQVVLKIKPREWHASNTATLLKRQIEYFRGTESLFSHGDHSAAASTAPWDSSKRRRGAAGGSGTAQTPPGRGSRIRRQASSRRAAAGGGFATTADPNTPASTRTLPRSRGPHRVPAGAQLHQPVLGAHENRAGLGAEAEAQRGARRGGGTAPAGPQQPQVPHGGGREGAMRPGSEGRWAARDGTHRHHLTAPPCRAARAGAGAVRGVARAGRSEASPSLMARARAPGPDVRTAPLAAADAARRVLRSSDPCEPAQITESPSLEESFKVTQSDHPPSTATVTLKPHSRSRCLNKRDGGFHRLPGKPIPMSDHSDSDNLFS